MSKSATENIHLNFYRMHPHAPKKEGKVLQKKWETLTHTEIQCTVFKKKKDFPEGFNHFFPIFCSNGYPSASIHAWSLFSKLRHAFFMSAGGIFEAATLRADRRDIRSLGCCSFGRLRISDFNLLQ